MTLAGKLDDLMQSLAVAEEIAARDVEASLTCAEMRVWEAMRESAEWN